MNIQLLKRLYSIYSPSGKEQKMVKFLCSYIKQLPGNISVSKDKFGNLYVVKGESESYPYLVDMAHQARIGLSFSLYYIQVPEFIL